MAKIFSDNLWKLFIINSDVWRQDEWKLIEIEAKKRFKSEIIKMIIKKGAMQNNALHYFALLELCNSVLKMVKSVTFSISIAYKFETWTPYHQG